MALETFGLFMLLITYSSSITNNRAVCILNRTLAVSAVCCDNYKEDGNGECKNCAAGYFGDFCEKHCPIGKFGDQCGGKCSPACAPEECNHVTGCPSKKPETSSVTNLDESVSTTVQQYSIVYLTTTSSLTSTPQTNRTTNRYTVLLSTIIASSTKSSFRNELFLTNYLIVSVGAFLGVLLIVLIIQKCSKSKAASQNVSRLKSDDHNETAVDLTINSHDADVTKYRDLYLYGNRDHVYQEVESDYQDIDQCLENENAFQGEKMLPEFNEPHFALHSNNTYLFPIIGKEFDDEATSDAYVKPVGQESYIEPQHLQPHLEPFKFKTRRKYSTDEDRHSYIEVIELGVNKNLENMHQLSSSYDDVMWECPTVSRKVDEEKDNTYLDAIFS